MGGCRPLCLLRVRDDDDRVISLELIHPGTELIAAQVLLVMSANLCKLMPQRLELAIHAMQARSQPPCRTGDDRQGRDRNHGFRYIAFHLALHHLSYSGCLAATLAATSGWSLLAASFTPYAPWPAMMASQGMLMPIFSNNTFRIGSNTLTQKVDEPAIFWIRTRTALMGFPFVFRSCGA